MSVFLCSSFDDITDDCLMAAPSGFIKSDQLLNSWPSVKGQTSFWVMWKVASVLKTLCSPQDGSSRFTVTSHDTSHLHPHRLDLFKSLAFHLSSSIQLLWFSLAFCVSHCLEELWQELFLKKSSSQLFLLRQRCVIHQIQSYWFLQAEALSLEAHKKWMFWHFIEP